MIRDARVLRAGFVPREVEHRESEVTLLSSVLEPITNDEPADTAIVTGPAEQERRASRSSSRNACARRSSISRQRTSTAGAIIPDSERSTKSSMNLGQPSTSTVSQHPTTSSLTGSSSTTALERSSSSTRLTNSKTRASSTTSTASHSSVSSVSQTKRKSCLDASTTGS